MVLGFCQLVSKLLTGALVGSDSPTLHPDMVAMLNARRPDGAKPDDWSTGCMNLFLLTTDDGLTCDSFSKKYPQQLPGVFAVCGN
jgi:hypothetical protein